MFSLSLLHVLHYEQHSYYDTVSCSDCFFALDLLVTYY